MTTISRQVRSITLPSWRARVLVWCLLYFGTRFSFNATGRYNPPYQAMVEASPKRVHAVHREPHLESYPQQALAAERGVTHQTRDIGPIGFIMTFRLSSRPRKSGLSRVTAAI